MEKLQLLHLGKCIDCHDFLERWARFQRKKIFQSHPMNWCRQSIKKFEVTKPCMDCWVDTPGKVVYVLKEFRQLGDHVGRTMFSVGKFQGNVVG